ncbi:Hypothetical predicted protein [Lecanosticta acicola]|uniref:Uncharacterized protein n=1 Tax=Lecanosticta acicola TaxID=111012 RepID=A0AAI8Z5J7_9PEZI|nr:Hypothetical predicted protein [Lecanosticta acicola]
MDRELPVRAAWARAWLTRTYRPLECETLAVCYSVSLVMLFIGIRQLVSMRGARRAIEQDASNRAVIFAASNKRLARATRTQFYITLVYLFHALAIWMVDAAIGIYAIKDDVVANPQSYDLRIWLELAINAVTMVALFSAVFILFPMMQMLGVGYLIAKFHRTNDTDGTLAAYVPAARIVTTQMSHLWMMLGFFVIAWWPVNESSFTRILVLEASLGSAMAWLHASSAFNFRADHLSAVEVQPLLGVKDGVRLYGKQVYALHLGNRGVDVLPQYESTAQGEHTLDEKTALL